MKNAEQSIQYRQENISGLRGVSLYAGHPTHGNTLSIGFLQYYGLEYYDVLNRIILWICTAEQPIPIFCCPSRHASVSPRPECATACLSGNSLNVRILVLFTAPFSKDNKIKKR